jgi:hypothetical protein
MVVGGWMKDGDGGIYQDSSQPVMIPAKHLNLTLEI